MSEGSGDLERRVLALEEEVARFRKVFEYMGRVGELLRGGGSDADLERLLEEIRSDG